MYRARERLSKHASAATDTHATEERYFLRGLCRDDISKVISAWRRVPILPP
jgi:hypothetical protein